MSILRNNYVRTVLRSNDCKPSNESSGSNDKVISGAVQEA